MATTTYGTEYVQSSDLVSNWPGSSLSVANRIDNVSLVGNGVNDQTGTSYTLVLADGGKLVTFSNAAAVSLTVPTNASVAFPTGVRIKLTNKGAGTVTVAGAGGVTLNGNQLTIAQNRSAMLYKLDTNTWVMTADPTIPGDPGLAFITGTTFTTSTGVNVNNCFSSTYDSYRVMIDVTAFSTTLDMLMRLRVSGADNSTTNYVRQVVYGSGTTAAAVLNTGQTSWTLLSTGSTNADYGKMSLDIFAPNLSRKTIVNQNQVSVDVSGNQYVLSGFLYFGATTVFDGFSLVPSTGNISGTVRVYGYRNS
jgi:hypothetical protein